MKWMCGELRRLVSISWNKSGDGADMTEKSRWIGSSVVAAGYGQADEEARAVDTREGLRADEARIRASVERTMSTMRRTMSSAALDCAHRGPQ